MLQQSPTGDLRLCEGRLVRQTPQEVCPCLLRFSPDAVSHLGVEIRLVDDYAGGQAEVMHQLEYSAEIVLARDRGLGHDHGVARAGQRGDDRAARTRGAVDQDVRRAIGRARRSGCFPLGGQMHGQIAHERDQAARVLLGMSQHRVCHGSEAGTRYIPIAVDGLALDQGLLGAHQTTHTAPFAARRVHDEPAVSGRVDGVEAAGL